jgi:phosphotransferase system HPr-like phosphotransfer protein
MVENDSVVAKLTAEAGQIETVMVSVTGSQEDKALEDLVSNLERRKYNTTFKLDAQML